MWFPAAALLLLLAQPPDFSAEGLKALEAQKYAEAAQLFAKALEADPKDYGAQFHLALAESLLGKYAEAMAGYKKVLELKPGLYQAELNLGIVLLRQKQARDAVGYLESAAGKKPKETRPRLYLAQALLDSGDFSRAEQTYLEAAELDPKSAAAQLGLAQARVRQNRLKEAEPHFRKAAELDPGFSDALLQLGSLYESSGQKTDAIAVYQQFPENVAARERLGNLLIEAGRPLDAIPHLEWVAQKSPATANRVALALAYRRTNQPEKELPVLEQAVQADPSNPDLRMIYGRTLRDKKNYAGAARQFFQVTEAQPDLLEAWNELAAMLVSLEDFPQALAALDRVKALGGETAGHHYLRAIMLDKARDYQGALDSYEKFLALSQGQHPDEEFKARQRVRIIRKELSRR